MLENKIVKLQKDGLSYRVVEIKKTEWWRLNANNGIAESFYRSLKLIYCFQCMDQQPVQHPMKFIMHFCYMYELLDFQRFYCNCTFMTQVLSVIVYNTLTLGAKLGISIKCFVTKTYMGILDESFPYEASIYTWKRWENKWSNTPI